jgi:hypothetical protein
MPHGGLAVWFIWTVAWFSIAPVRTANGRSDAKPFDPTASLPPGYITHTQRTADDHPDALQVDGAGERYEVDGDIWRGALVSAWLRYKRTPRQALAEVGADCVRTLHMASTPDHERTLLACVMELYASGDAQVRWGGALCV